MHSVGLIVVEVAYSLWIFVYWWSPGVSFGCSFIALI